MLTRPISRSMAGLTAYGARTLCTIAVAILYGGAFADAAAQQATPVGLWNTISDVDGRPTAIVEIRALPDSTLVGTVRALLVVAGPEDSVCTRCTDARRGRPIVGMEILRRLHRDGNAWSGGEILDPETGKTYRAKVRLSEGGRALVVRGYLGLSLFGRSQTWRRRP
jgi:uncharacterized protein (DUF2147 family)